VSHFIPPEDPPPEVAAHLWHMTDGHWHDHCRFCLRRREKGGNGVLPEDYLPPVPVGVVQDLLVEARRILNPPTLIEASVAQIEGGAWDDGERKVSFDYLNALNDGRIDVRDGHLMCDFAPGRHCDHWTYTTTHPCCKCGTYNHDPRTTGCTEVLWRPS
jgi:hypothetical protein